MDYIYNLDDRGIATVTLNRPEIHNAFNDELIKDLTDLFNKLNDDDAVKVIVLTGEGKSFCAGADLNWMKRMIDYSDKENFRDSINLSNLFKAINNCERPVIGRINGAALGGGSGLVSVCDYVIASDNAKFGFTEVRLGLVPAVISPYVISKIKETNARAYFLSGERFDSNKAKEIGLVHEVVSLQNIDEAVNKKVEEFLKAGPMAVRAAKALIKNVVHFNKEREDSIVDYTCKAISKIRISPEGQEGMGALLEKRKPNWIK